MRIPPPSTQNATVIPRIKEPIRPPETAGLIAHVYLDATVAASRFRPFARRRFKIARPAFVFIRSRKPCLRSRLIRLGWYVRFIAADPHSRLFVFQLSIHNPAARGHDLQNARRLLCRLSESPSVFSTYLILENGLDSFLVLGRTGQVPGSARAYLGGSGAVNASF